jgi:hypothetical protein
MTAATDPLPASETFACPSCGGSDFALQLGGRRPGTVKCSGCGLVLDTPEPEPGACPECRSRLAYSHGDGCSRSAPRGRGRPPIGRPLTVRLPDELRARVAAAALPGERDLAETVRRLLDSATAAPRPPRARRKGGPR